MLRPFAEIACLYFVCGTLSWKRLECQDALRVAVVPCTSAIRALLAFSFGHDPAQMQRSEKRALFDQLVGAGEERRRQREPERIRGLEVDDQFNFCGLLDR
jgi:hypothetical protein